MAILPTDSLVAHITLYIINIFLKSHFCVKKETCDLNDLDDFGNGITYFHAKYGKGSEVPANWRNMLPKPGQMAMK